MSTLTQVDSWIWLAVGFVGLLVAIGYAAKEMGRNRVAVHDGLTAAEPGIRQDPDRKSVTDYV